LEELPSYFSQLHCFYIIASNIQRLYCSYAYWTFVCLLWKKCLFKSFAHLKFVWIDYYQIVWVFFFFSGNGEWIQGLACVRQVLSHLSHAPSSFVVFEISHQQLPGWLPPSSPPASASWVAVITDVNYHVLLYFLPLFIVCRKTVEKIMFIFFLYKNLVYSTQILHICNTNSTFGIRMWLLKVRMIIFAVSNNTFLPSKQPSSLSLQSSRSLPSLGKMLLKLTMWQAQY
jgi:hypothetical protein